jgi:hypothetical protein
VTHPEQDFIDRLVAVGREHAERGTIGEFEELLQSMASQVEHRLDDAALVGVKAMMLAPTIDICRALLRGERIHWTQLDYFNAQRYGTKNRPPDGRLALDDFNDFRAPA